MFGQKKTARTRILLIGACALMVIVAVIVARHVRAQDHSRDDAPSTTAEMPPAEVTVMLVGEEPLTLTTELPARTSAYLVAEVRPQVNGIVQKRLFTEGSDVKEGEVLYQIDPAPYQAVYDNAVAALARSKAKFPAIKSRAERNKQLISQGAISQQEFDDAIAAEQQAEADIEYWEAGVESARINLEYTRLKAPIAGRIGRSAVTVGALATAHQGPAFATIQQLDPIYVDAPQSSAALLRMKRNMADGKIKTSGADQAVVRLRLEDGMEYPHEGKLRFSDVTVEPGTGSFILRMVFPNPEGILLPGMYVRSLLVEGLVEKAILIPQRAISRDPKGNAIALVVDASDTVEQRMLTVDRAIDDNWLVLAGLNAGDRLIVEGLQKVRPGAKVHVAEVLTSTETPASSSQPVSASAPVSAQ